MAEKGCFPDIDYKNLGLETEALVDLFFYDLKSLENDGSFEELQEKAKFYGFEISFIVKGKAGIELYLRYPGLGDASGKINSTIFMTEHLLEAGVLQWVKEQLKRE